MKNKILSFALPLLLLASSPAAATEARILWVNVEGSATVVDGAGNESTAAQFEWNGKEINAFRVSVPDGSAPDGVARLGVVYENAAGEMVVGDPDVDTAAVDLDAGSAEWAPFDLAGYADRDLLVTLEAGHADWNSGSFERLAVATNSLGNLLDAPHVSIQSDLNPPALTPWAPDRFTVTAPWAVSYDLAGGTNNPANPTSYTVETELPIELLPAGREGYTFAGWTNELGVVTNELNAGSTGDRSFGATWLENVEPPTLGSKAYTGEPQTADVPSNAGYTVVSNAGGTDVGSYDVVLAPAAGYAWSDGTTASTNVAFAITNRVVTLTGDSGSATYSGTAQTLDAFETAGLVAGHVLSGVAYAATGTDVAGSPYAGAFSGTPAVTAPGDVDVTANYAFEYVPGALAIGKAALVVAIEGTPSASVYTGSEQTTNVAWKATLGGEKQTVSAVSHTENLDDLGNQNSNYGGKWSNANIRGTDRESASNQAHVITIPGADMLTVTITYGGESATFDYVCAWAGDFPNYTAMNNVDSSFTGKLGGVPGGTTTYEIPGDTVTFSFRSDSSGTGSGYGYYAVVTAELGPVSPLFDATKVQYAGTATVSGTNAGDYPYGLDATKFSYDDANIDATFTLVADAAFTIVPASTMALDAAGYVGAYDAAAHSNAVQAVPAEGTTVRYSTDNGETWTLVAPSITNVGELAVLVQATNANYVAVSTNVMLQVTNAWVTATASDVTVGYGTAAADIPYAATYAGWAQGEDESVLATPPAVGYAAYDPATTYPGTYEIAISGAAAPNYAFAYVPGTLTVTAVEYAITYDLAGGALAEGASNPATYTVTNTFTLVNPTKEGHTFAGWTGTGVDGTNATVTVPLHSTGDRAYTATWTPIDYTVTWKNDDGSVIDTTSVPYGGTPTHGDPSKSDPSGKYGYSFAGWTPAIAAVTGETAYAATWTTNVAFALALPLDPATNDVAVAGRAATVALAPTGTVDGVAYTASPAAAWDDATTSFSFADLAWNQGVDWSVSATQGEGALAETARNEGRFYAKASTTWFAPADGEIDDEMSNGLVGYTAAAPSASNETVRIRARVEMTTAGLAEPPEVDAAEKGVFAVLKLAGDTAAAYYAWDGSGWVKLAGAAPVDATVDYLAVYDLAAETPCVRYYIDGVALYAEQGGQYAIPLRAGTRRLEGVYFADADTVGGLSAVQDVSYVATVGDTPYTNAADVVAALAAADKAAANDVTVTLLADVAGGPVELATGEQVTVAAGVWSNGLAFAAAGAPAFKVVETAGDPATTTIYSVAPNEALVTWYNGAAELYGTNVTFGVVPAYVGEDPERATTATTVYTFDGWSDSDGGAKIDPLPAVDGPTNYYAHFSEAARKYTLTVNYTAPEGFDAPAQHVEQVANGAGYSVESPAVAGCAADPAVVEGTMPTNDVTVTVAYTLIEYAVTWNFKAADGSDTNDTTTVVWGQVPSHADPAGYVADNTAYSFLAWDTTPAAYDGTVAAYTAVYAGTSLANAIWIGGASGDWDVATNWDIGYVPTPATVVTFTNDAEVAIGQDHCKEMVLSNACVTATPAGGASEPTLHFAGNEERAVSVPSGATGTLAVDDICLFNDDISLFRVNSGFLTIGSDFEILNDVTFRGMPDPEYPGFAGKFYITGKATISGKRAEGAVVCVRPIENSMARFSNGIEVSKGVTAKLRNLTTGAAWAYKSKVTLVATDNATDTPVTAVWMRGEPSPIIDEAHTNTCYVKTREGAGSFENVSYDIFEARWKPTVKTVTGTGATVTGVAEGQYVTPGEKLAIGATDLAEGCEAVLVIKRNSDGSELVKTKTLPCEYTMEDFDIDVSVTAVLKTFDVVWLAEDGETRLDGTNGVPYGTAYASLSAPNPTKEATAACTYTFAGWVPQPEETVTSNATYTAVFKTWTKVAVPAAATGLFYDGTAQTGVPAGDGYTVSGNVATNAGDYAATVTLADPANTVWADDASAPTATTNRTVNWSIAPAAASVITVAEGATVTNTAYFATLAAAIEAAPTNSTVQLLADVEEPAVALDTPITLDLNGHDWTVSAAEGETTTNSIAVSAPVSVVDSSEDGYGTIRSGADTVLTIAGASAESPASLTLGDTVMIDATGGTVASTADAVRIGDNASLVVDGGSVGGEVAVDEDATGASVTIAGGTILGSIDVGEGATATVNATGGSVQGNVLAMHCVAAIDVSGGSVPHVMVDAGSTVAVSGADTEILTIEGESGSEITVESGTVGSIYADGTLAITGGTFTGFAPGLATIVVDGGTATISDGNFYGRLETTDGGTISITGGFFSEDPSDYVAPGYYAATVTGGYRVLPQKSILGTTITVADAGAYDGAGKEPAVTVTTNGVAIAATDGYTLSWANNTNATAELSLASVTVRGFGAWTGETNLTFTIAKKPLVLVWSGTNLAYTGTSQAPTAEATGIVAGDDVSIVVSGAQTEPGTYTAAASLSGAEAGNYALPDPATTEFTITAVYVAQVGETKYFTIAAAVEAAGGLVPEPEVITLLTNADASVTLTAPTQRLRVALEGYALEVLSGDPVRYEVATNVEDSVTVFALEQLKADGLMIVRYDCAAAKLAYDMGTAENMLKMYPTNEPIWCTVATATDLGATTWTTVESSRPWKENLVPLESAADGDLEWLENLDATSSPVRFWRIAVTPFVLTPNEEISFK